MISNEGFMATVESVENYGKKEGFITCSLCGSKVTISSRNYGGMGRVVCSNFDCANSEEKSFTSKENN